MRNLFINTLSKKHGTHGTKPIFQRLGVLASIHIVGKSLFDLPLRPSLKLPTSRADLFIRPFHKFVPVVRTKTKFAAEFVPYLPRLLVNNNHFLIFSLNDPMTESHPFIHLKMIE